MSKSTVLYVAALLFSWMCRDVRVDGVFELGPFLWKCAGIAVHFYLYFNICLRKQTLSASSTSDLMGDVAFTEITNTVSGGRNLISVSAD